MNNRNYLNDILQCGCEYNWKMKIEWLKLTIYSYVTLDAKKLFLQ